MAIPEPIATLAEVISQDPRYKVEAYIFLQRSLAYAQKILRMGRLESHDLTIEEALAAAAEGEERLEEVVEQSLTPGEKKEQHLTGQELCEAIRYFAQHEYGFLAKLVLNSWGIYTTGDFGEIVYNMIRAGLMKKSRSDRREDFDDVYDFDQVFQKQFRIHVG